MKTFWLFLLGCVIPGVGGAVGSILGNAFGKTGLWIGGVAGGLVFSGLVAIIAAKLRLISGDERVMTAVGTAIGFVVAAAIAVNTLSSPVGPVLSTAIAGLGAVLGSRLRRRGT